MKVAVLMGSPNDRDKMQPAADILLQGADDPRNRSGRNAATPRGG